jgi:uncharacterized RmlC-like cupin family protein
VGQCTIVGPGGSYSGAQGLHYGAGISTETADARAICMHRLTMPPGTRAQAHLHEDHESCVYVISGRIDFWWGPGLEHHAELDAGDFVHIPAGVPHLPANTGDVEVEAVLARTDPSEQESVVTLPELDGLAHLPRLAA